eukprot:TRINITY_DN1999_c1_g1_i3.p1 TRINITY_DN1999_c1_g1~~TRINITY_DN1999_c1_g1_i3.p1  ORF type:complete len:599 (-),score=39.63 TRINITY_DN1999_c1_g1_i3:86-1882(-)
MTQQSENPVKSTNAYYTAAWSVGEGEDNIWIKTCCSCGEGGSLQRCAACPRSFHPGCIGTNLKCSFLDEDGELKYLCPICSQQDAEQLLSSQQVNELIQQIVDKCQSLPSAHPVSVLGETLKIANKRQRLYEDHQLGQEKIDDESNVSPPDFERTRNWLQTGACKRMKLSEVEQSVIDNDCTQNADTLMHINAQFAQNPQVCSRIQDAFPLPNGRSYLEGFSRDGISTPQQCRLPKSTVQALKQYARLRYNQDIQTITQNQLQKQMQFHGFKELRMNYYMRFDMDMDEMRHNRRFWDVVGNQSPWMKLVYSLLGQDCFLHEILCQIARPGAPPQSTSSDELCSRLFPKEDNPLPPYAVKVFIPLTDLYADGSEKWNGAFEFVVGSHRGQTQRLILTLGQGQAALVDFRVKYRCLGNCSKKETLIMSLLYVKRGFRAAVEIDQSDKPSLPRPQLVHPPKNKIIYPIQLQQQENSENIQSQPRITTAAEIHAANMPGKRPILPKIKRQLNDGTTVQILPSQQQMYQHAYAMPNVIAAGLNGSATQLGQQNWNGVLGRCTLPILYKEKLSIYILYFGITVRKFSKPLKYLDLIFVVLTKCF